MLREPDLDQELARTGAVRVPFLSTEELSLLRRRVDALGLAGGTGFYDTASAGLGMAEREELHAVLCDAFADAASELLVDHDPVMSALLVKWPGEGSAKEIHRDFRLVDESQFRSVCIWVPFDDVDEANGALSVLPGSHLVDTGPRSVPSTPDVPVDPIPALRFEDLECLPVAAGDAVVFDMAVAHGSDVNRDRSPRLAVAVAYAPRSAQMSLYYRHDDDRVEELAVPDPGVFRRIDWRVRPAELRSLGFVTDRTPEVTVEELVHRSRTTAGTGGRVT